MSLTTYCPDTFAYRVHYNALLSRRRPPCEKTEMKEAEARDIEKIWKAIKELGATWLGEKPSRMPGMPSDRREFWAHFAMQSIPDSSPLITNFIEDSNGSGKTAIDLGCGSGVITQLLVDKGWKVISVDFSGKVLKTVQAYADLFGFKDKIATVQSDVNDFEPAEPVDLIVAEDVLMYTDPTRFEELWGRISAWVKEEGHFLGTFLHKSPKQNERFLNQMEEMGAWGLPDRRMVRPLLTSAGYKVIHCKFRRDKSLPEPVCIEFVAKKLTS